MSHITEFKSGDRVSYRPKTHNEMGTISSMSENYIHVKFDEQVGKFGWDGTTSKACYQRDLVLMNN